ncbi:hypothetical protein Dred_2787 [Desulforamulus reducens MI-1]|uniref:CARDB domain-containing protein n=1 Tax=Desulforamulus reducens (strain ATCC BAA-1160 / DSM 100696 / MI-1) TaxID=349161 RepID=A4J888_DESRM|nr:hypothetical protein [Desulforamulus reducens]ABO51291.1 hypothetical protein Dred_2787 [Desulforamulus reducens MI-1]
MKKKIPIWAIMMMIAFFFTSITPALAEPEEQLFHRLIISGYYAMYQDGSGHWVAEEFPGQVNRVKPGDTRSMLIGQIPCNVKAKGKITRVEVKTADQITEEMFDKNTSEGSKTSLWRPMDFKEFDPMYLRYISGSITPSFTMKNDQGDVEVTANVLLGPINNAVRVAKEPDLARYYANATWAPNSSAVLWTVPVVVEWYGIPLAPVGPPDFSVQLELERFKNVKPGDKVTSTVTYTLNKDYPQQERAWLRLHHVLGGQEYAVTFEPINSADALDANGYVTFQPGESKTYRYTFTVQDKPSKILARINPVDTDQDKYWPNNRDEALVTMQNLRVEIISKPESAHPGEPVSVGARIFNEMADMQVTRLVAKINGKVVYDIDNFDVISMADKAVNFKMPDSDATVEFYINPDREKPADEITYADNIAKCTIKKLAPIIDNDGNLKVTIMAPSRVQPFKKWTFTVKVEGRFPPPPPPPSKDDDPTATISLKVNGKAVNIDYHLSEGTWGDVVVDTKVPVNYQKSTGITVPRGKKFSKTVTFTFPATTGFPGQDYPINLHAKATWRNYNGEDTSKTMIFLKPMEPEAQITL